MPRIERRVPRSLRRGYFADWRFRKKSSPVADRAALIALLLEVEAADEEVERTVERGAKTQLLADAIADQLDGRELGSHIVAKRTGVKECKSKIVVDVKLVTEHDEDEPPRKPEETAESIERALDRKLDDLDGRGR